MKASLVGGAIGALVLANAAAFVAVDQHFKVPAAAASQPSFSAALASPSADAVTSSKTPAVSTNSASPASTAEYVVRPASVFVVATNSNDAWRAYNSGGCQGSVTVQATQDGGRTWSTKAMPPVGAADGISINAQGNLQLSGQASAGCAQGVWALDGTSWTSSDPSSWVSGGVNSANVLHAGQQKQACDSGNVIDLATAGNSAYVLCSTGAVRKVSDSGSATTAYQGPGLLSIATTKDNTLVVARSAKNCDGVQLATISGTSAKSVTCVQGASKAVDLTFAGNNGWLVAAHNTWTGKMIGDWSKS